MRIKKSVHLGGALFSTGIQVLVAHTNLTNPGEMAKKNSFVPEPDPKLKTTGNINDLLPLLTPSHVYILAKYLKHKNPYKLANKRPVQ